MASRGEIVHQVIRESGISVTKLAEKIRISRAQLYQDFTNPEMSFDRILAIGKVLKHDFSQDFKELSGSLISLVNEEPAPYVRELDDCRNKLLSTQGQLIEAMSELARYKQRYGASIND